MNRLLLACLGAAVPMLAAGCATTTPAYDLRFGEAVRQARALQTLNPDAGRDGDTLPGIDGPAARAGVDRYHGSFREPPPTFEVLNIGGVSTGSR